jgi:hypothetical protein
MGANAKSGRTGKREKKKQDQQLSTTPSTLLR